MYTFKTLLFTVTLSATNSMSKDFDLSVSERMNCVPFNDLESYKHLHFMGKSSSCMRTLISDYLTPSSCLTLTDSNQAFVRNSPIKRIDCLWNAELPAPPFWEAKAAGMLEGLNHGLHEYTIWGHMDHLLCVVEPLSTKLLLLKIGGVAREDKGARWWAWGECWESLGRSQRECWDIKGR